MEKIKKLLIGVPIFLFVMCIGMSFSYGYDYVFKGTGSFIETDYDGSNLDSSSGTLTRVTISVNNLGNNIFYIYFDYVRSDGQAGGRGFQAILRGSQLYFNRHMLIDTPLQQMGFFGTLTYTGQLEITLNENTTFFPSDIFPFGFTESIVYSATCSLQ
jgi:hypothetical protein